MNCSKLLAVAAIAASAIFVTNNASAVMGAVNISGTASFELQTNAAGTEVMKTVKKSFKTIDVLALLANATGNSWFTNKGSLLVFDPDTNNVAASEWYDGTPNSVYGIFWVTNTVTHDSFRLDFTDGLGGYHSYIELDFAPWFLGFSQGGGLNLNGVFNGKYVGSPYSYSSKILGNATLYIHDDPDDFDYPDNLDSVVFDGNNFAIVITGPMTYSFSYSFDGTTGLYPAKNSFSIKGSGDGFWNDETLIGQGYLPQPVFTASVKHSDSGKEPESEAFFAPPF